MWPLPPNPLPSYLLYSNQMTFTSINQLAPSKPVVENCGIVLGEIEAFRAWRVFNGLLVSMAVDDVWLPGEPMKATDVDVYNMHGAHAFKTLRQARNYMKDQDQHITLFLRDVRAHFAIGRVKLWGTIVEHETGYRAEFAKPIEIISCQWRKLDGSMGTPSEIAARYGVKG